MRVWFTAALIMSAFLLGRVSTGGTPSSEAQAKQPKPTHGAVQSCSALLADATFKLKTCTAKLNASLVESTASPPITTSKRDPNANISTKRFNERFKRVGKRLDRLIKLAPKKAKVPQRLYSTVAGSYAKAQKDIQVRKRSYRVLAGTDRLVRRALRRLEQAKQNEN